MDAATPLRRVIDADTAAALFLPLASSAVEIAAIAFLDPEWRLLGVSQVSGTPTRVLPSIRAIVRDALAFDAAALVLGHCHPGGDPRPSAADLAFTRRLGRTLESIGVTLVDHLILGGGSIVSLRNHGLL